MVKRLITLILSVFIALGSVVPMLKAKDDVCPTHGIIKIEDRQAYEVEVEEARAHKESAKYTRKLREDAERMAVRHLGSSAYKVEFTAADIQALVSNCHTQYKLASDDAAGEKVCKEIFAEAIKKRNEAFDAARKKQNEALDAARKKQEESDKKLLARVMSYTLAEAGYTRGAGAHDSAAAAWLAAQKWEQKPYEPSTASASSVPAVPQTVQHQHHHSGNIKLQSIPAAQTFSPAHEKPITAWSLFATKFPKFARFVKLDTELKQDAAMGLGGVALFGGLVAAKRSFCYRKFNRPNFFSWTPKFFARKTTFKPTSSGIPAK